MKQFSLEEYLKNPSKKVVTRDGRSVKILCTDFDNPKFPVIGEIESVNWPVSFTTKGLFNSYGESNYDLFFVPEEHEGWINLFGGSLCGLYIGDLRIFESKENAEKKGKNNRDYVKSIKIKWEE